MPSLDACINDLYEPGNIPGDPGVPPTVPVLNGQFNPPTAQLTLSTEAPIRAVSNQLFPASANLALSTTAPTAARTDNRSLVPATANLILSTTAPTIVAVLWTPAELGSALKVWLQADLLAGADGTDITTWSDSSGNSNDATTGGGFGNKPSVEAAGLNSMKVVRADSSNNEGFGFDNFFAASFSAGTVFHVAKNVNDAGSEGPLLRIGSSGSADHYSFLGDIYDSFLSTTRKTVGNPPVSLATWHIAMMRSATNDYKYFQNGTQFFTTATNTVGADAVNKPHMFESSAVANWDGRYAEMVLTDTAISSTDREKVEGYLAYKWGIQSVLDTAHPYKSTPPYV